MKRKKWFCLLLSVLLLLTGCGEKGNKESNSVGLENGTGGGTVSDSSEAGNTNGQGNGAAGGSASDGSGAGNDAGTENDAAAANALGVGTGGIAADDFYDIELSGEAITSPLQEEEVLLGAQYFNGERIWFIGDSEGQIFCYYEGKEERELLENIPAEYQFGYTWYRDDAYFYVYSGDTLAVLRENGEKAYALQLDGRVEGISMSKEGEIVLVTEGSHGVGSMLKVLDRASGGLSGGFALSGFWGIGEGVVKGVLLMDEKGVYDLDMKSGEKSWYMKWGSTSYRPGMTGGISLALKMEENGTLKQLKTVEGGFQEENLNKIREYKGKKLLIFRVNFANTGLKLLVTRFNQENQEYHVMLQDAGGNYGDFVERNDMEIATGKGPDLFWADAVSDIYGLAAKGALENLENYDKDVVFCSSYYYTPNKLLGYFFQMSDDFYGMVDWEKKTCSFSGELWEKILRVVKRYGVTERNQQWSEIAIPVFAGAVGSFARDDMEAMRDGMVLTGYPSEEGMKYALAMYGVSINAASEYKEGAWQFIKFLLEEENQKLAEQDFMLPVCQKVLQEYVAEAAQEQYTYNNEEIVMSEEQLARFWECINSAEPAPYRTDCILEIIREEAALYFTGDKTIEEISGIIENRVRLYLAEMD